MPANKAGEVCSEMIGEGEQGIEDEDVVGDGDGTMVRQW